MAKDIFQDLDAEHRAIEAVLTLFEQGTALEAPWSFHRNAVQFLREYGDAYHHAREESLLFPLMLEKGVPAEHGPIGCMLEEHEQGREHVQAMHSAIEAEDRKLFHRHAILFADLLRTHIMKEDRILYPMARRVFSNSDLKQLTDRFEEVDAEMSEERKLVNLVEAMQAARAEA